MKYVMLGLALALCITATAQSGKTQRFRWNWRNAQELDLKHSIGRSDEHSEADKQELLRAIAQQMKTVMDAGADSAALAAKTRVKPIDLNGDGRPEVIAQPVGLEAGCGATGNCPLWVFEKAIAGYKLILGANGFQVFTIEQTATNGFRDIVLGSHDSASERTLFVFRYSKGQYHQGECYKADWWTYEGGYHKLREPKVTPCAR